VGEEEEGAGYGEHGGDEAGEDELGGDALVAAGALGEDGNGSDGRHGSLKQEEQGDVVAGPEEDEHPDKGEGEDDIFNEDELGYFTEVEAALLLEVEVEAAAEDNHDEGEGHGAENLEDGDNEVGEVGLDARQLDDDGDDGDDEDGVENAVPARLRRDGGRLAEEEAVGAEEEGGVEHDEDEELGDVGGVRAEDAAEDDEGHEDAVLEEEAEGELGAGVPGGEEAEYKGEDKGDNRVEEPPEG